MAEPSTFRPQWANLRAWGHTAQVAAGLGLGGVAAFIGVVGEVLNRSWFPALLLLVVAALLSTLAIKTRMRATG